jgi:hypothetical protein
MVTFRQLRDFDPGHLQLLGAMWSGLARQVERRADHLNEQYTELPEHWEGEAYETAAIRLRGTLDQLDTTGRTFASIDVQLMAAADDLLRARGMLLDALDRAARIPATVSDDGVRVTYTGNDVNTDPAHRERITRRVEAVFDDIDAALATAERADRTAADALRELVPGHDPLSPGRGRLSAGEIPQPGSPPRRVNRWWQGLTPSQRRYVIHAYPGRIGNLDGIPVIARDEANRMSLVRARDDAEADRRRLETRRRELRADIRAGRGAPAANGPELLRIERRLAMIDRDLRGVDAIEDRLYQAGPLETRAYLVTFEPSSHGDGGSGPDSDGRAVIALGNPDTANHVATYLPGTGADLDSARADISRASAMADDARELAPAERTSVIMWLDYDAPDTPVHAATDAYAEGAAGDLRRFQDGLRVTHDAGGSHNTVIGHSYGSTTIGYAARGGGLDADELVFVGSPGVGVDHAAELRGVSADHVWATRARHDLVRWLPDFWFGEDPTSDEFGGRSFTSHPGSAAGGLRAHSAYWDDGNPSRRGMAGIITGNYHLVPAEDSAPAR